MSKRLTEILSSNYVAAANKLRPKSARHKILAFVESYDDIAFWHSILSDFENDRVYFQIVPPSQSSLTKGKKTVLANQLGDRLGYSMIACIDSDYDYLLQDANPTSSNINSNPFIFQTYTYSIENYQCYAESLHEVCVQATMNDREIIDFVELFRMYSEIAFPLLAWSVWFHRRKNKKEFSIADCCHLLTLERIDVYHMERSLWQMNRKVQNKIKGFETDYPIGKIEVEKLQQEFNSLGVTPDNSYLFVQGHHIMDAVVMRILAPVCNILRREREMEIQRLAEHSMQYRNELSGYENRQTNVNEILRRNTDFRKCPMYEMIVRDLQRFMEQRAQ
ncbi:MAG: DUF4435 domain-containing protein [Bacteroidales bacterium]|nr:DUF4435 domain-containing protein [Bacteroidales bacterium]